jgi:hypothetical protein
MSALAGVLGCRPLRRIVQVRLGTNPAVPRNELPGGTTILFALAALRSVPQAGSQFHGLATAIHEISGLGKTVLIITPMNRVVATSFLTSWLTTKKSCKITNSGLYLRLAMAGCHNF